MSFTEKVLMKSLRFTELIMSHETKVLNMATEIMGLSSQIPEPTKPYAGKVLLLLLLFYYFQVFQCIKYCIGGMPICSIGTQEYN